MPRRPTRIAPAVSQQQQQQQHQQSIYQQYIAPASTQHHRHPYAFTPYARPIMSSSGSGSYYHSSHPSSQPIPQRHSPEQGSGRPVSSWTPQDDSSLLHARQQGLNWQVIANRRFPGKTPNACRKRHERLMERSNADEWDGVRLELLATTYMDVRQQMWEIMAQRLGEKWQTLEAKCMAQGFKNLNAAARSANRRSIGTDDSGIGMDEAESGLDTAPAVSDGTGLPPLSLSNQFATSSSNAGHSFGSSQAQSFPNSQGHGFPAPGSHVPQSYGTAGSTSVTGAGSGSGSGGGAGQHYESGQFSGYTSSAGGGHGHGHDGHSRGHGHGHGHSHVSGHAYHADAYSGQGYGSAAHHGSDVSHMGQSGSRTFTSGPSIASLLTPARGP